MANAASPAILALGEAMVEFNQVSKDQPDYLQGFGGDTSNFCVAAARQGATAGFVSAVGDDHFGRLLLDLWQCESVHTSMIKVDSQAPTGVYFVSHGPDATSSIICGQDRRRAAMPRAICRLTRWRRRRSCICPASVSQSA